MISLAGIDEMLNLSQIFEKNDCDVEEYKKYIMAMLFYAFLSLKQEKFIEEEFGENNISFEEGIENDEMKKILEEKSLEKLGYFIKEEDSFKSIIKSIDEDTFCLELLEEKLNNVKNSFCWEYPNRNANVFNLLDWSGTSGKANRKKQTELISEVLLKISENNYLDSNLSSFISQLYQKFQQKQYDNFYVVSYHINSLLYDLIRLNGKKFEKAYDASCNLNRVHAFLYSGYNIPITGFEVDTFTCSCDDEYNYNLINMYPLMHEIKKEFHIKEKINFKKEKGDYDLIISTVGAFKEITNSHGDENIMEGTYSDMENLLLGLDKEGIMTVIIPTSYVFDENSPIINHMKNNILDAIIKLPELNGHNYSILVFKEDSLDTLLIDASYLPNFRLPESSFFEDDYDNFFYHPDIRKKFRYIRETYEKRIEMENFSHIICNQELNKLKSLESYNIIHVKEEDDSLNPIKKELKSHRFPAPPWIKYPTIPLGSMGWRMGAGEDYIMRYTDYIDDKRLYDELFPRPVTWNWIREGDESISEELRDFMRHPGGKYKFFTSDGKPKHSMDYESEKDIMIVNATEFDLKDPHLFRFAIKEYTTLSFIEDEKTRDRGINVKPLWDEVKYTLCLNANYSKIVSDKKLVDKLLETGEKVLIYIDDSQWGVQIKQGKMVGENLQGLALMQVRDEIRKVYENYDIIDWDISNYI